MATEKILTKKERREQIRSDLEAAKKAAARGDFWWKAGIGLVVLAALGAFVWIFISAKNADKSSVKALGQSICFKDDCPHTHIDPGSPHPTYSTNPPNSGDHYPTPAQCKIYDNEVIDEYAVHSLEHGAVWITYKDKNDTTLRNELIAVYKEMGGNKLLLSPRSKKYSAIALTSWGRILKLDKFDKQKIEDYIKLYRNGPSTREPLATC